MAFDLNLALMKEPELDMQKWKKKKNQEERTALTKAQMWERLGCVAKY